MNAIKLRQDITVNQVQAKADASTDAAARTAWTAIMMVYEGGKTVGEICKDLHRSPSWFYKTKQRFMSGGLETSFARKRAKQVRWKLKPEVETRVREMFEHGQPVPHIRTTLAMAGTKVSPSHLYTLRKEWGIVSARRVKPEASTLKTNSDRLKVAIPRSIMDLIATLLDLPSVITRGCNNKKLGMLWILGWRQIQLESLESRSRIPKRDALTEELQCSPMLMYQVADAWNAAKSQWTKFINTEFCKVERKNILLGQQRIKAQNLAPQFRNAIKIRPADGVDLLFRDGTFERN